MVRKFTKCETLQNIPMILLTINENKNLNLPKDLYVYTRSEFNPNYVNVSVHNRNCTSCLSTTLYTPAEACKLLREYTTNDDDYEVLYYKEYKKVDPILNEKAVSCDEVKYHSEPKTNKGYKTAFYGKKPRTDKVMYLENSVRKMF